MNLSKEERDLINLVLKNNSATPAHKRFVYWMIDLAEAFGGSYRDISSICYEPPAPNWTMHLSTPYGAIWVFLNSRSDHLVVSWNHVNVFDGVVTDFPCRPIMRKIANSFERKFGPAKQPQLTNQVYLMLMFYHMFSTEAEGLNFEDAHADPKLKRDKYWKHLINKKMMEGAA
jgi:hypothetical protein